MTLQTWQIVLLVVAPIVIFIVISLLFKGDDRIEERRREAIELQSKLQEYGLDRLASLAQCYAIGDYTGLYHEVKLLTKEFMDSDRAITMMKKVVYKMLPKMRDDPEVLKILKG